MYRTFRHLIAPLAFIVACSEPPTPPSRDLTALAASVSSRADRPELASIVWETKASDVVRVRLFNPINASRAYALVGLAQYAAADAAKKEERRGAVAAASVQVLSYLSSADATQLEAQLASEGAAGTADEQASFARGVTVGRAIGDIIVARGRADGFANANGTSKVWDPATLPAGPGIWFIDAGTAPPPAGFQFPFMRPYFLTSADQFRPAQPTVDLSGPVAEVITIVNNRTPEQAAMAVALNLSTGTITPLGDWDQIAMALIRKRNMDERAAAHVFALLNSAVMDAVTACWDAKFEYLVLRPWQVAPADLPNSKLNIGRPNHPSFPSGHSCVSGAAATVLTRFFPEERSEHVQHMIDNGNSRIYAGIHYRFDVEGGQELGRSVAEWAIHYDRTNGLLAALLPGYRGNDDR
jgi:membrane-associated phospholipid phosphatase